MILISKYELNQDVCSISTRASQWYEDCEWCAGTGKILAANSELIRCDRCRATGKKTCYGKTEWFIANSHLTIGQIEVVTGHKEEERYMCKQTGLGSGQNYPVDMLFPTLQQAQNECDKRNKELADD